MTTELYNPLKSELDSYYLSLVSPRLQEINDENQRMCFGQSMTPLPVRAHHIRVLASISNRWMLDCHIKPWDFNSTEFGSVAHSFADKYSQNRVRRIIDDYWYLKALSSTRPDVLELAKYYEDLCGCGVLESSVYAAGLRVAVVNFLIRATNPGNCLELQDKPDMICACCVIGKHCGEPLESEADHAMAKKIQDISPRRSLASLVKFWSGDKRIGLLAANPDRGGHPQVPINALFEDDFLEIVSRPSS